MAHLADPARRTVAFQPDQQLPAPAFRAFGDHFHPAVLEILSEAGEAEFQRSGPHPPSEANPLDASRHPGGEPKVRARTQGYHRPFLGRGWQCGQK